MEQGACGHPCHTIRSMEYGPAYSLIPLPHDQRRTAIQRVDQPSCSFVYGFYGSKVLSGYAKAVLGNSAGALYAYTHVYVCIHIRTTANGGPGSFAGRARSDLAGPICFWQGQARQIWLSRTLTPKAHATDLQVAPGGPFSSD